MQLLRRRPRSQQRSHLQRVHLPMETLTWCISQWKLFLYQVKQSLMSFLENTLCFHGTLTHCILQAHMPLNMLLLVGSMNGTSFLGSRNYTSGIIAKRRLYAQTATDRCREDHFDNHVVGVAKVVHVYFADPPEASSSQSCA